MVRPTTVNLFLAMAVFLFLAYGDVIFEAAQDWMGLPAVDFWDDDQDSEVVQDEEVPEMHLVSAYIDLMPFNQLSLLRLYFANEGRDEANWTMDQLLI